MAPFSRNERLLWALIEHNDEAVKKVLKEKGDANLSSPTGSRPLHIAALRDSASLINILLEHNAKVDQANDEGLTPLMVAAQNGKMDAVRVLLEKGADPMKCLNTGETALHLAMKSGSQKVVNTLLDGGADINAQTMDSADLAQTTDKFTPLHFAALYGASQDFTNVLLGDELCDATIQDSQGRTAGMVARDEGHDSLAKHIEDFAELFKKRSKADQDLVTAVMDLDCDAAKRAVRAGANANLSSPTGSSLLHAAALRGSASLVGILADDILKQGNTMDQADLKGFTPLMVAALNGREEVTRTLLEKAADPNLKCLNTGETALHMAMAGESPGVVAALLKNKADINAQTTDSRFTPLHIAALFDPQDLTRFKGNPACNAQITDSKGRTADQLAGERDKEVRILQDTPGGTMTKAQVITRPQPTQPSDSVHKVTSLPRGRVLVLNYEEFGTRQYENGAVWDAKKLGNLFIEMGYDVSDISKSCNLKYQGTKDALKSFRDSTEMATVDCAVVCVLSHGKNQNSFFTSDYKKMKVEEVYEYFTDDNCPNLKDKPKLFLFNFCRGKITEPGCIPSKTPSPGRGDHVPKDRHKGAFPAKEVLSASISLHACKEGITALPYVQKWTLCTEAVVRIFAKHAHNLPVDKLVEKVNEYMKTMLAGTTTSVNINTSKKFYLNPTRERKVTQQQT